MRVDTHIIVFAKAPVAGEVKTRMIPTLSDAKAADLAQRLLDDTLARVVDSGTRSIELCCAPDVAHPALTAAAQRYGATLSMQLGADLGERMAQALQRALMAHPRALLIGTDCPALDARVLNSADAALDDDTDAVFVPALDGGYVLVGAKRVDARLFSNITWSSDQVMAQTRTHMQRLGWRWIELPALPDVDRPDDLVLVPRAWYA